MGHGLGCRVSCLGEGPASNMNTVRTRTRAACQKSMSTWAYRLKPWGPGMGLAPGTLVYLYYVLYKV